MTLTGFSVELQREFVLLGVVDAEIALYAAYLAEGGVAGVFYVQGRNRVHRLSRSELGAGRAYVVHDNLHVSMSFLLQYLPSSSFFHKGISA